LLFPVAMVFQHLHPAMKIMVDPQVAAWGEANKPRVLQFLQFLDGELKGRAFVAGEAYTVADITAMIAVDFMRVSRLTIPDDLANVRRWYEAVSARPSAKA
jgi:glutathione S-transferase